MKEIDQLRQAYVDAFTQVGWCLKLLIGGIVLMIFAVCWSLVLKSVTIKSPKPFDPEKDRKKSRKKKEPK